MDAGDQTIHWLSEWGRNGREQTFIFIGRFREIPGPVDDFGNRPRFYYRITGSYYSLNKFRNVEKYFGQATYEGDWFILKKVSSTGSAYGQSKLPTILHKERMGSLSVRRIEALSEDACGEMDFYGNISSTSGVTELRTQESNDLIFSRSNLFTHDFRWVANESVDYEIKIVLKDWDGSAFCGGGNDYVDINPERGDTDDLADAYLELLVNVDGTIRRKVGSRTVRIGQIGEDITIQGDCSESGLECARVTFRVNWGDL